MYSNTTNKKRAKFSPLVFNFIALSLIIILTTFYLTQANQLASSSFQIKELEERVGHLRIANEMLELEIASLKSLSFVKEQSEELGMVSAGIPEYVVSVGSAVAVK